MKAATALGLVVLGFVAMFVYVLVMLQTLPSETDIPVTYEKGIVGEFMIIEEFYMFDNSNIKKTLIQNKETKKCYIYSPESMSPFRCNI